MTRLKALLLGLALAVPVTVSAQDRPYSLVVEANGVLYVAGQLGYDRDVQGYADGIQGQTRAALRNVDRILTGEGATLADVVRCNVFLTDIASFRDMNAAYVESFPSNRPARTTVGVAALPAPDALIEIECTAVRGHGDRLAAKEEPSDAED